MAARPAKVFLDSNVILSAFISELGPSRLLLDVLSLGLPQISGYTGTYNLLEIERVLQRKLPEALSVYRIYFPKFRLTIAPLPSPENVAKASRWIVPHDAPVLAAALAVETDYLITGNRKDFETPALLAARLPLEIYSPGVFVRTVLPRLLASGLS
jgi:predicted nucleic acid-binding protein